MISEKKIDSSPLGNFLIGGFSKTHRLDHDLLGGGILLYVKEDIPSNLLKVEIKPIEDFYVTDIFIFVYFYVIDLHNDKWLINCSYNPHKNMIGDHLHTLSEKLDIYSSSYNNFTILDDFNIEMQEQQIKAFCDNYSFTKSHRTTIML